MKAKNKEKSTLCGDIKGLKKINPDCCYGFTV